MDRVKGSPRGFIRALENMEAVCLLRQLLNTFCSQARRDPCHTYVTRQRESLQISQACIIYPDHCREIHVVRSGGNTGQGEFPAHDTMCWDRVFSTWTPANTPRHISGASSLVPAQLELQAPLPNKKPDDMTCGCSAP